MGNNKIKKPRIFDKYFYIKDVIQNFANSNNLNVWFNNDSKSIQYGVINFYFYKEPIPINSRSEMYYLRLSNDKNYRQMVEEFNGMIAILKFRKEN